VTERSVQRRGVSTIQFKLVTAKVPREIAIPNPTPRYVKLETLVEKWYCSSKTVGNVVNRIKRRPKTNAYKSNRRSTISYRIRSFIKRVIARKNS
jgi:hypothetical protein